MYYTGDERFNHPIASKIPGSLFWEVFHNQFNDALFERLEEKEFHRIELSDLPEKHKHTFIYVMLKFDEQTAKEYLDFAQNKLKLVPEHILIIAAAMGKLDIIKLLKTQYPSICVLFKASIDKFDYLAFRYAAKEGHLEILKWFKVEAPKLLKKQLKACDECGDYAAFRQAAMYNHVPILEWIKEQWPEEIHKMIDENDSYAFRRAKVNGSKLSLSWLNTEQRMGARNNRATINFIQNDIKTTGNHRQPFSASSIFGEKKETKNCLNDRCRSISRAGIFMSK